MARMLVAEDSGTVRRLVARILAGAGHEVLEATDGIEAITRTLIDQPDLVVLDLEMPGCDGIEALRRIRGNPGTAATPVLLLSSRDDPATVSAALAAGAADYVRKPCHPSELVARVERALGDARALDDLRHRSLTDELTGLPNRRGFDAILDALTAPANEPLAVAVVDADHFKRVNDTHGHEAGDLVLRELARRLAGAWPVARIARWGGEEFIAVFPAPDAADAIAVADRLRVAAADGPIDAGDGLSLAITVSVGVGLAPTRASLADAITDADLALYEAKAAGRDRVAFLTTPVEHR